MIGDRSKEDLLEFSKALGYLISEMESKPFTDILGPFYLEIGLKFSRDLHGEFYTPKDLGDAMAQMLVDVDAVIEEGRAITVSDPASGSGGLILSLASKFAKRKAVDLLRVTCQDTSKTACDMAYINTTLWGVPAKIIHGDTLRRTTENVWLNAHWARVGEPQRERGMALEELIRIPVKGARKKEPSSDTGSDHDYPALGLPFD